MSKPKLNNDDYCRAAKRLSCDVAAVKTVADVESKGEGFYADGFPTILFERHKFRSFTNGKYNTSHPHISGPAGNYGKAGANQRNKFNLAFSLDPEAAMKSCSWGKFQIMGFNYAICGFQSVGAFVDAMKESEGRQLDAFVSFVKNNGLADELRENDWAGFARGYNGADYRKNKYDTKMAAAYRRYLKEEVDCSSTQSSAVASLSSEQAGNPTVGPQNSASSTADQKPEIRVENVEQVKIDQTPPPSTEPVVVTVERVSVWAKIGAGFAGLSGIGISMGEVITGKLTGLDPMHFVYVIGGVILIALALYFYDKSQKRAHEKTLEKMKSAADPAKNTVELTRVK